MAVQLCPRLELGVIEVRQPIAVGNLVLEQEENPLPQSLLGARAIVLELELQKKDATATGIVRQWCCPSGEIFDGFHRLVSSRHPKECARVRRQDPTYLAIAASDARRHLHDQAVVRE